MWTVAVEYGDGCCLTASLEGWPTLRGEDVQRVMVSTKRVQSVLSGHSLYWLYPEPPNWVVGAGSVRYSAAPLTELLLHPNGQESERHPMFLPDLPHQVVKLGWWAQHG